MYFPFSELHGWGKRTACQPQTIDSEFPYISKVCCFSAESSSLRRLPAEGMVLVR